jgi:glyoxylase I family protein
LTRLASPQVRLDRLMVAWTADPDGNPIEIVQRL